MIWAVSAGASEAVRAHAQRDYPREACGVLAGRPGAVLEAIACSNADTGRARDRYRLDPIQQLAVEKGVRARGMDVVGYYHSHPDHPALASSTDLELSWEGVLYLIVSVRSGVAAERRLWLRPPGARSFEEAFGEDL